MNASRSCLCCILTFATCFLTVSAEGKAGYTFQRVEDVVWPDDDLAKWMDRFGVKLDHSNLQWDTHQRRVYSLYWALKEGHFITIYLDPPVEINYRLLIEEIVDERGPISVEEFSDAMAAKIDLGRILKSRVRVAEETFNGERDEGNDWDNLILAYLPPKTGVNGTQARDNRLEAVAASRHFKWSAYNSPAVVCGLAGLAAVGGWLLGRTRCKKGLST